MVCVSEVVPLDNWVPPEAAVNQSTVLPAATDAEMVILPDPHLEAFVPVGAVGRELTVATTEALDRHPLLFAVSVYVPADAVVTALMVGLSDVELNPLGPTQL